MPEVSLQRIAHKKNAYRCPDQTQLINSMNYCPAPKYLEKSWPINPNKNILQNKNGIQYSNIKCSWNVAQTKIKNLFYTNFGDKESEKVLGKKKKHIHTMVNPKTSEILI